MSGRWSNHPAVLKIRIMADELRRDGYANAADRVSVTADDVERLFAREHRAAEADAKYEAERKRVADNRAARTSHTKQRIKTAYDDRFLRGLKLREIAEKHGISKARAGQLIAQHQRWSARP